MIYNINLDLKYIQNLRPQIKMDSIILCEDFNISHPDVSLSTKQSYNNNHIKEYDALSDICNKYKLTIINKKEEPTHIHKHNGEITVGVVDLTIVSNELIQKHYEWDVLSLEGSDHLPVISQFYLDIQQQTVNQQHQCIKHRKI